MNIGTIEKLKIEKIVDYGAFLHVSNSERVLLPKKQIPKGANIGDEVTVFLYKDSLGRPIATINKPFLTLGQVAKLTVVDVSSVGAFLNFGLERDLLLPYSEQINKVSVGDKVDVLMYVDKSDRLCATMYTNKEMNIGKVKNSEIRTREYEQNAEKVYKIIKERFKGHLIYTDKTATPERLDSDFNMSKTTFKKAIGKLLKDNRIKITDKGIFLFY